jgi:hypothetical protein
MVGFARIHARHVACGCFDHAMQGGTRISRALLASVALSLFFGCGTSEGPDPTRDGVASRSFPVSGDTREWFQTQKLTASDALDGDELGTSVALFGDRLVLGAPKVARAGSDAKVGAAYVFERSGNRWAQVQKLVPDDALTDANFGTSVALSDDVMIVGAPGPDAGLLKAGAAYAFTRAGALWSFAQKLEVSDSIRFGAAVAMQGNLVVVGAPFAEAVYVYERTSAGFTLQKKLEAPGNPFGSGANFGQALAISGTTVVVGAPFLGPYQTEPDRGAVFLFVPEGDLSGDWPLPTKLLPSDMPRRDKFGAAVAISEDLLVVGAPHEDYAGVVYFFTPGGGALARESLGGPLDVFGGTVAISGEMVAVGAPGATIGSNVAQGSVALYAKSSQGITAGPSFTASDGIALGAFGTVLAFSQDVIVNGVPGSSQGTGYGQGAAYVHELLEVDGSDCSTNDDCGNGHCVSGTCCESRCDAPCASCATGLCEPVRKGREVSSCGAYLCDGIGRECASSCAVNNDCVATHYCRSGECVEKRDLGATCSGPDQCKSGSCGTSNRCVGELEDGEPCSERYHCRSGNCADGVCCDAPCEGQCEACNEEGSAGECVAVADIPRGDRSPCPSQGETCGGSCDGVHRAECSFPPSSRSCGSTCADAVVTLSTCDGLGACVEGTPQDCNGYACGSDGACKLRCEGDEDCTDGRTCAADGTCGPAASCDGNASVRAVDGTREDCGRYRCDEGGSGECKTSCATADDCVSPNACSAGACGSPPNDDGGCGCRTAPARSGGKASTVVALALLAFCFRRARSDGSKTGRST